MSALMIGCAMLNSIEGLWLQIYECVASIAFNE